MGRHAYASFSRSDFSWVARTFRTTDTGRFRLYATWIRENVNFLFRNSSRTAGGNNILSDLRMIFEIFTWFDSHGRGKDGSTVVFEEIDIGRRMRDWSAGLSVLSPVLPPDQAMANFFSLELEKGRIARPPYKPYVVAESLAEPPWFPADETRARSSEKWQASQKNFNRYTGSQDLAIGQFALYRMKFIMAGDLADARGGFGGLVGQLNHLANVLDMSITDHPGIAATYGRRIRALIQKTALKRSSITDYFDLLSNVNAEMKEEAVRDFESRAETARKEKGKRITELEKERAKKNKDWKGKGKGKKEEESDKTEEAPVAQRKCTKEEWTAWNKKKAEAAAEAKPKAKTETDSKKVAQGSK